MRERGLKCSAVQAGRKERRSMQCSVVQFSVVQYSAGWKERKKELAVQCITEQAEREEGAGRAAQCMLEGRKQGASSAVQAPRFGQMWTHT